MIAFLLRRALASLFVLFTVATLTFLLVRAMPGSPFSTERALPEATLRQVEAKYDLSGTRFEQLFHYYGHLGRGDLGPSTQYWNRTVNEIVAQSLPVSLTVGAAAFVLAPLLVLLLGVWLEWLPIVGWGGPQELILPAFCLAAPFAASVARLMRTSLLEVLNQDFVRTARAKGLPEYRVVYGHALKVAILPVLSYAGPLAANLLTGSIVIESLFAIPGIGPFFVNSVLNKDVFMVGGIVLTYSVLLILFNLLVDVAYAALDKRIRLS